MEQKFHHLGKAPDLILDRAWVNILSEFYGASEDEGAISMVSDLAQIAYLDSRILRVRCWCMVLLEQCTEYAADKLRDLGYSFPFTPDTYLDDIERTLKKLRNLETQRDQLVAHIKEQTAKTEAQSENSNPYASFDEKINAIERVFKVPIDTSKMTALMYAIKLRDLKEFIRKQEQQNQD